MSRSQSLKQASGSSKLNRRGGILAAAVAGVLSASALVAPARAGTFTWDITKSGNWSIGSNWIGLSAPTGFDNTDQLIFGGSEGSAYTSTVDNPDPFTINGLTLNSSATTTTE